MAPNLSSASAIAAAFVGVDEVTFPAGIYALTGSLTIAAGKRVRMTTGAVFVISGGATLTINGLLDAGAGRIFAGAGSVVGLREVKPEWWGALVDTPEFDSQPALQAAHACVQASLDSDGPRPTIRLGSGSYYLSTTWLVQPTANCQLQLIGQGTVFGGTRFIPMAGFPSEPVVWLDGQSDAIMMITNFVLRDFAIIRGGGSPSAGLRIGRTTDSTHRLIGLHQSLVECVEITDIDSGIEICHTRQIAFERCAVWNNGIAESTCVLIHETGWFAGDLDFIDCELVGNGTAQSKGVVMRSVTASDGTGVAGIRFRACYTSGCDRSFSLLASGGGSVHDIWVEAGTQIDFAVAQPVYVSATGYGSYVRNLQIKGLFIAGGVDQITLSETNYGQVLDISVIGCWLSQATGRAMLSYGASGVTCDDNFISNNDNSEGAALHFIDTMRFSCNGNKVTHTTPSRPKYLVQIEGSSNRFSVIGNIGDGVVVTATVNDVTPAIAKKVVANNL